MAVESIASNQEEPRRRAHHTLMEEESERELDLGRGPSSGQRPAEPFATVSRSRHDARQRGREQRKSTRIVFSLESSNSGSPPTRARAGALVTHQRGAHPAPPSRGCEWVVKGDPRLLAYGSQPAFGISFPLTCIYFLVNAQHEIRTRYCPIPRFTHKTQKTFII